MRAMSGTRGSSGLGSHNRLQIDSSTADVCTVCVCTGTEGRLNVAPYNIESGIIIIQCSSQTKYG